MSNTMNDNAGGSFPSMDDHDLKSASGGRGTRIVIRINGGGGGGGRGRGGGRRGRGGQPMSGPPMGGGNPPDAASAQD